MVPLSAKQKYDLKKLLKQLALYRGSHTELVSVYVPAGYDLVKITQHLAQEQGTASNIKYSSTRKNVVDALERMLQHLKLYKGTPPNGLAVFSGNVAEREGQSNVQVFAIEPPLPLNIRIYRCDKTFVLDPLQDMADAENTYGLVVLDRRDATLALLKGSKIVVLIKTHSEVPGKTRAGGQSSQRFARQREGAAKEHYRKVAEYMKDQFLPNKELKGILIGGPAVSVSDFMNESQLTGDLVRKILATKDLGYTDESGLEELVDRSQDVLSAEAVADEKKYMQRFFEMLAKEEAKTAYGISAVKAALDASVVDMLLLSESLDEATLEELEKHGETTGAKVLIVSTNTREGEQLRDFGKVAAILRYAYFT